ncbi:Rho-related BTB domain-containing protein 1 [Trichoplax sp. H2]|nr:Rho-related BTB domain-containing protein 1 [Trichoplax sp. H2]|eukprot:RDD43541.1 Rho-related BTB domain-containing protein 1 [Trichoplax sp. H2]
MEVNRHDQESVKCVVVGDAGTGKSRLVCARAYGHTYSKKQLAARHVPTVFAIDEYRNNRIVQERSNCMVDGVAVKLLIWDTFGDHDKDRRYAYENANAVILCYSTHSRQSYDNCRNKWKPEIRKYCPNVPLVLNATQVDLRYAEQDELKKIGIRGHFSNSLNADELLLPEDGRQLAKEIDAAGYYETSMINNYGVNQLFENAVRMALVQRRKLRFWNSQLRQVLKPQAQKPYLLPKRSLPNVSAETSTYWSDIKSTVGNPDYADIQFIVRGTVIYAHNIILCAAWPRFHDLVKAVGIINKYNRTDSDQISLENTITGLKFLYYKKNCQQNSYIRKNLSADHIVFTVDQRITLRAFWKMLEYLYSCQLEKNLERDLLIELHIAADILSLDGLQVILANLADGKPYKNAVITDDARQKFIARMKMLYTSDHFQVSIAPDATFEAGDTIIPINRVLVTCRCDVLAAMFSGSFLESGEQHAKLPGICKDTLLSFLEYLYTDECELKSDFALEVLVLANQFCLSRLVSICESFMAEELREIDSDYDLRNWAVNKNVIHLLRIAEMHNAFNLHACCVAYISNNYLEIQRQHSKFFRESIDYLTQKKIEEERWPPSWYSAELQMYEKEYGKRNQDIDKQSVKKRRQKRRLFNVRH